MAGFHLVREEHHYSWRSSDESKWSNHLASRHLPGLLTVPGLDSECHRTSCSSHLAADNDEAAVNSQLQQTSGYMVILAGLGRAHPCCCGEESY